MRNARYHPASHHAHAHAHAQASDDAITAFDELSVNEQVNNGVGPHGIAAAARATHADFEPHVGIDAGIYATDVDSPPGLIAGFGVHPMAPAAASTPARPMSISGMTSMTMTTPGNGNGGPRGSPAMVLELEAARQRTDAHLEAREEAERRLGYVQWYWRELLRQLNGLEDEEARKRERWAREDAAGDAAGTGAGGYDTADDDVGCDGGRVQPSPDYTNSAAPGEQLAKHDDVAILRGELGDLHSSLVEHTANVQAATAGKGGAGGASDGAVDRASPVGSTNATPTQPGMQPSVLKVSPPCELAFKPVAGDKTRSSATIQLENPTSDTLWFKIKLTSPSRYTIDPHMGKISGHAKKVVNGKARMPCALCNPFDHPQHGHLLSLPVRCASASVRRAISAHAVTAAPQVGLLLMSLEAYYHCCGPVCLMLVCQRNVPLCVGLICSDVATDTLQERQDEERQVHDHVGARQERGLHWPR